MLEKTMYVLKINKEFKDLIRPLRHKELLHRKGEVNLLRGKHLLEVRCCKAHAHDQHGDGRCHSSDDGDHIVKA